MKNLTKIKKQAFEFLSQHSTMVVSTVNPDHTPHAATVYYTIDSDWNFYFITDAATQKMKNIDANPTVSIVVGTGPAIFTIQGQGTATRLFDDGMDFMNRLAQKLNLTLSAFWPVTKLKPKNMVLIKIKPTWLTALNLDSAFYADTVMEGFYPILGKPKTP